MIYLYSMVISHSPARSKLGYPHNPNLCIRDPMNLPFRTALNPAWWFGTMEFYDFPFSWECHHPNWIFIFFRGIETTNQYISDIL